MKHSILIVEDNIETATNIRLFLEHSDFDCETAHSGKTALALFEQQRFDLVVLDVMLPQGDGFFVCQHIRQKSEIPIIMLTAKVSESDVVKGLNLGADDYVKKPYSNKELVARVRAHLRRAGEADTFELGPYCLNKDKREVSVSGSALTLTPNEFDLLYTLLSQPGRVFSREQLFLTISDEASDAFDRTVDVHLHNLRKKIISAGANAHHIKSVYGIGYKLDL